MWGKQSLTSLQNIYICILSTQCSIDLHIQLHMLELVWTLLLSQIPLNSPLDDLCCLLYPSKLSCLI